MTLMTSMTFPNCLRTCSMVASSPLTTTVSLESSGFSVSPTVRLSILNPLLVKRPTILARTPTLFSTRAVMTCLMSLLVGARCNVPLLCHPSKSAFPDGILDGLACWYHGEDVFFLPNLEVNHHWTFYGHGLLKHWPYLLLAFHSKAFSSIGLGHLDKVWVALQMGLGVPFLVKEFLPLADHPQIAVIHDGYLHGELVVDHCG